MDRETEYLIVLRSLVLCEFNVYGLQVMGSAPVEKEGPASGRLACGCNQWRHPKQKVHDQIDILESDVLHTNAKVRMVEGYRGRGSKDTAWEMF